MFQMRFFAPRTGWSTTAAAGLRRLHARFGGALCGVPMRRDAYAGMCWLDRRSRGAACRAVAQRAARLHRPLFRQTARACAVAPTRWTKRDGSRFPQPCRTRRTPPRRPSGRACGWASIFLAQYPDYNDQLFPTLLRCEKRTCGVIFLRPRAGCWPCSPTRPRRPTRWIMKKKNAQGIFTACWISSSRDGCPPGIPRALTGFPPAKKKDLARHASAVGPLYGIGAIKPAIAAASLLPVLHAGRYTLAADEACRVTVFFRSPLPENTLTLNGPDGGTRRLPLEPDKPGVYRALFRAAGAAPGLFIRPVCAMRRV